VIKTRDSLVKTRDQLSLQAPAELATAVSGRTAVSGPDTMA
jgi:hypothetical protein